MNFSFLTKLFSFIAIVCFCGGGFSQVQSVASNGYTISVSGKGAVDVKPDHVLVFISIENSDVGIVEVRKMSDDELRNIQRAAKGHGVTEDDFEFSELDIRFSYNEELRRNIYKVSRRATIDLKDLDKLNALLADLLKIENIRKYS